MDLEKFNNFKRWAIIALFTDEDLSERLVIKGGTALQIDNLTTRASMDIDVSMIDDFLADELEMISDNNSDKKGLITNTTIGQKLKTVFQETFSEYGYTVFDFKFIKRPNEQSAEKECFWGGYRIEFKIYKTENIKSLDMASMQKSAENIGKNNGKVFSIDISKYEACSFAEEKDIDGYTIYIYTPPMIVCEKIRALCQQLPEYIINKGRYKKPRPRDFYDIYTVMQNSELTFHDIDITILKEMFKIKKVEFSLLDKIISKDYYNFSITELPSLIDTLPLDERRDFDFDKCFDFVANGVKILQSKIEGRQ